MKREIKFRGKVKTASFEQMIAMLMGTNCKSPNEGVWVYGDIRLQGIIPYIHNEMGKCPIDVDTIGQYTGLKDKNGREIYEGDIVEWLYINIIYTLNGADGAELLKGVIEWRRGGFIFRVLERDFENTGWYSISELHTDTQTDVEVIGNIYDNPELLTEK